MPTHAREAQINGVTDALSRRQPVGSQATEVLRPRSP